MAAPWFPRLLYTHFRETELLPTLMLRSQSGPHTAAWLSAIPSEAGSALPPDRMLIALRPGRSTQMWHARSRLRRRCRYGDHHAACPRTGLLARRAKPLEHAWVRIAREAVGPEGQVVPQQWLARTSAPHTDPADRRCLDFVAYRATALGGAVLRCHSRGASDSRGEAPALCCLSRRRRHHCR